MIPSKAHVQALQRLCNLHLIREIEANRELAQERPILLLPKTEEGIDKGNDDLIVHYKTLWVGVLRNVGHTIPRCSVCVQAWAALDAELLWKSIQSGIPQGQGTMVPV